MSAVSPILNEIAAVGMPLGPAHWYAIHTRSRHEKLVAQQLAEKEFDAFLPLRLAVHRWKDRFKKVEVPLFGGYLFVQMAGDAHRRVSVLRTPGVVRIVGFGERDAVVPDEQIAALRRVLAADNMLHRHRFLRVGQRLKILNGALAGLEGILARVKGENRLVINITPIRQAIAVEVTGYDVAPI